MRKLAALCAAFGVVFALPASALTFSSTSLTSTTTLSKTTTTTAGILPTSSFSFIDTTFDALAITFSLSPESKVQTTLAVSEERAAESAVMSSIGNIELAASTATAASTDLAKAVMIASTADATLQTAMITDIQASTTTITTMLQEGVASAPLESKTDLEIALTPIVNVIAEAPKAVTTTTLTTTTAASCDQTAFTACVRTNGCTEDTSETCFKACPPKSVTCEDPKAGKTCKQPDVACVNQCLNKIISCFDSCLTASHCSKDQVNTTTLKLVSPEEVQRVFQLQLQAQTSGTVQ